MFPLTAKRLPITAPVSGSMEMMGATIGAAQWSGRWLDFIRIVALALSGSTPPRPDPPSPQEQGAPVSPVSRSPAPQVSPSVAPTTSQSLTEPSPHASVSARDHGDVTAVSQNLAGAMEPIMKRGTNDAIVTAKGNQ